MGIIEWLQRWYEQRCDGYWEHMYGIEIGTIDNPGWHVKIDLRDTNYENINGRKMKEEKGENDWISCVIKEETFQGFGDIYKLNQIIETFKEWIGE